MQTSPEKRERRRLPASDFAAPLPACHLLWHTELLRGGSRILLGIYLLNLCLEIASDRRILPACGHGLYFQSD